MPPPALWLSDGWDCVQANQWSAPLYWERRDGEWWHYTLDGMRPVHADEPVCHVSYYEADAFARWAGARLATELEWEMASQMCAMEGNFVESGTLHPRNAPDDGPLTQMFGDVWEWTGSAYLAYPGFQPAAGAVGEYNGKFMSQPDGVCAAARAPHRSLTSGGRIEISFPHTRGGSLWGFGWPMATSNQLQFLANDATAIAARDGLNASPKRLPSWLFYDEAGSALFEQITELPEYYLTRTERAIFESYAGEMLQAAGPSLTLVELGAGTATKTCILIEELLQRQSRVLFYPIDVSPSALQEAERQLGSQFPQLRVNPIVADYTGGVEALSRISGRKLVLYIGSSIGNFEPDESIWMLRRIRRSLRAGDACCWARTWPRVRRCWCRRTTTRRA